MGKSPSPRLIINTFEQGPTAITLLIRLCSSETMLELAATVLVDTGATGDFIDAALVRHLRIPTRALS